MFQCLILCDISAPSFQLNYLNSEINICVRIVYSIILDVLSKCKLSMFAKPLECKQIKSLINIIVIMRLIMVE